MTELTDIAEREAAAELLLESKGFADSVVSLTDGTADVVICQSEISEAERAQIEDIVKRKTGVSGSAIIISPCRRKNKTHKSPASAGDLLSFSPDLRTCCADRRNVIQECKNPIAEGDFKWIFAVPVQ